MAKKKSLVPYRKKTKDEYKPIIDGIVMQLEKHGRAVSTEGNAVRIFSRYMLEPIRKEKIYFTYKNNKSIITLPPSIRLVRTPRKRIKLIFDKDLNY